MASCQSAQWVSTAPYIKLTVTESASTATSSTLSWTLQYIAEYAADTSVVKSYSVKLAGATVKSGTFGIDGKTGTHTIASGTKTITKTTSAQTISFSASFAFNITWSDVYKGTVIASGSISVPAKTSYSIKYNANGGSGAPSAQTKWYGTALTLSSTKPTRSGYAFQGWATSTGGAVAYAAGASYTANASVTLYAVWSAGSYTVTYHSNGGTGAPAAQTKTYNEALTLSSTKPTMTNHTFKGWGTSPSSTTVAYAAGASYTKNVSITLYAIWELSYAKPSITTLDVFRCDSAGTASDSGTYFKVSLAYTLYSSTSSTVKIEWITSGGTSSSKSYSKTASPASMSAVLGGGAISTDSSYIVTITITDSGGSTVIERIVPGAGFAIDFTYGNKGPGAAIGKPAEKSGVFEVALDNEFLGATVQIGNRYTMSSPGIASTAGYIRMASINITAANADTPITFVLTQRQSISPMILYAVFKNSTATASDISSFTYEGSNYDAFLVQTEELVWDLYVLKGSNWDTITLQDWYTSHAMESRISITFPGDLVETLPTPYHRATPAKLQSLLDYIYPVGSVYISYSHVNPGTMFGGTWARIENAFLWGVDSSGTIGQTGGEKTHTLTVNELPAHTHGSVYSAQATGTKNLAWYSTSGDKLAYNTVSTGGGAAHNNMPPYIQVSIWRRTA